LTKHTKTIESAWFQSIQEPICHDFHAPVGPENHMFGQNGQTSQSAKSDGQQGRTHLTGHLAPSIRKHPKGMALYIYIYKLFARGPKQNNIYQNQLLWFLNI